MSSAPSATTSCGASASIRPSRRRRSRRSSPPSTVRCASGVSPWYVVDPGALEVGGEAGDCGLRDLVLGIIKIDLLGADQFARPAVDQQNEYPGIAVIRDRREGDGFSLSADPVGDAPEGGDSGRRGEHLPQSGTQVAGDDGESMEVADLREQAPRVCRRIGGAVQPAESLEQLGAQRLRVTR